jgi:hypothetical protein
LSTIARVAGSGAGSVVSASPVPLTAVSGTITPNAAAGNLFRHDATTNVTLAAPTGGTNGESIDVQVYASGGDRVLTVAGTATTIPSGSTWWGKLSYNTTRDEWVLYTGDSAGGGGSPSGAASGVLSGTYPNPGFAADMATQAELDSARTALQSTIDSLAARVSALEAGGSAPTVPGAPTIGTVTGGNAQASVPFAPPTSNGGRVITGYTATSTPGGLTASGTASPLTVTGLTNGTSYTFKVKATNSVGTGPDSAASNAVTPAVPSTSDITASGTPIAYITSPTGSGNKNLAIIKDGVAPAAGTTDASLQYDTFANNQQGVQNSNNDWFGYSYNALYSFTGLTFTEGVEFGDGGWFTNLQVQVRQNGLWTAVTGLSSTPTYPNAANTTGFQTYSLSFTAAVGDGIRIYGPAGGTNHFVTVAELRVAGVFSAAKASPGMGFNWPNAIVTYVNQWDQQSTTYANRTKPFTFAQSRGASRMRTFIGTIDAVNGFKGLNSAATATQTWTRINELLTDANTRGVKLVCSNYLTQETIQALAGTTYASWPAARAALVTNGSAAWNGLKAWIDALAANGVLNHAGVYSWEVVNEPNYMLGVDDGSVTRSAAAAFIDYFHAYYKTKGAPRTNLGGRFLYDKSQVTNAEIATLFANCDWNDDHCYPLSGTNAEFHIASLDAWVERVNSVTGRAVPMMIGEYGTNSDNIYGATVDPNNTEFFTRITDACVNRGWYPVTWGYDSWDIHIFNETQKLYVGTKIDVVNP